MLINELSFDALMVALEEYKNSSYYQFYDDKRGIIESIEEDRVTFNEDGTISGEYRICSECGSIMYEGFCINEGEAYYCTGECLLKNMTAQEYQDMYNDDEAYYTNWY